VTVTNDKIFEEPVYNSTRDFPYIWEEIRIPIHYTSDRGLAERILLDAAEKATADAQRDAKLHVQKMAEIYDIDIGKLAPSVYYRITDNWLELTLRFLVSDRSSREIKDIVSRQILARFDQEKIGIASTTVDIVAFPPVRVGQSGS
jgi:small-conductance mechanosensitive channel